MLFNNILVSHVEAQCPYFGYWIWSSARAWSPPVQKTHRENRKGCEIPSQIESTPQTYFSRHPATNNSSPVLFDDSEYAKTFLHTLNCFLRQPICFLRQQSAFWDNQSAFWDNRFGFWDNQSEDQESRNTRIQLFSQGMDPSPPDLVAARIRVSTPASGHNPFGHCKGERSHRPDVGSDGSIYLQSGLDWDDADHWVGIWNQCERNFWGAISPVHGSNRTGICCVVFEPWRWSGGKTSFKTLASSSLSSPFSCPFFQNLRFQK